MVQPCTALLPVAHRVLICNCGQQNRKRVSVVFKNNLKSVSNSRMRNICVKQGVNVILEKPFLLLCSLDQLLKTGKSWHDSCTPVTGIALSTMLLHSSCIFCFDLATLGFAISYVKQHLEFLEIKCKERQIQ